MEATGYLFLFFFLLIFAIAGLVAYLLSPSYVKVAIALGAAAIFILILIAAAGLKR